MKMLTALTLLSISLGPSAQTLDERVAQIERALAPVEVDYRYGSLGPVASKIYRGDDLGVKLGLTSEFFTFAAGTPTSVDDPADKHANVLSLAPTFGFRPHERLYFNAQINFTNGGAETSNTVALRRGSAVVRFAYLDWTFAKDSGSGVRLGHQLIPLGRTNTDVDATTYFGVRRPLVERELIPADWHENGLLAYWNKEKFLAEIGFFSSLNARNLRGETFLAGGSSQGQNSPSSDVMTVGRANVNLGPVNVGGSLAAGGVSQGNDAIPGGQFRLGELHARYRRPRLDVEVQVAGGRLDDANLIGIFNQTRMASLGLGQSLTAGFRVLPVDRPALWAFARLAHVNLGAEVPGGLPPAPRTGRREGQLGLNYLPLPTVVVKADVTRVHFADEASHLEFWAGAGFLY